MFENYAFVLYMVLYIVLYCKVHLNVLNILTLYRNVSLHVYSTC